MIARILLLAGIFEILNCSVLFAEIRLPRIIGDNMILQQQTDNAIWGWANSGEAITVSASWGATSNTTATDDGRWKVFLKTPDHGTGHFLRIEGDNTILIQNVAIGEVWLCAGQSNMGWSTANSFEAEKELDVSLPNLRIFKSQREHWHEPLEESRDRLQRWKSGTGESASETSAVSYYFGKTLQRILKIPVGVIVQAYAGTPIEGWMSWEIQSQDPRSIAYKKALDQLSQRRIERGETVEKSLEIFANELSAYDEKINRGETMKNPFRVLQPPFITKPASLGHQYPSHIYNAMISPIQAFGIRGMIWYQGERNSKNVPQAIHYQDQLKRLIDFYRASWHRSSNGNVSDDFPVQFTQLPSWHQPQSEPVEGISSPWVVNRESMRLVDRKVPNTGMVVTIDTGDSILLHPKNKKPIGIRHALLALQKTYGRAVVGTGPIYKQYSKQNGSILIEFESVGSGLVSLNSKPLNAFAIAGSDQIWHWADAEITGDAVVVSSPQVAKPIAVRYAWAMNPSQRNLLYNREGLPASPFRTDDWELHDPSEELVEVLKPQKPQDYQPEDWERPEMLLDY